MYAQDSKPACTQTYDAFAYWGCFTAGQGPHPVGAASQKHTLTPIARHRGCHHLRSGKDRLQRQLHVRNFAGRVILSTLLGEMLLPAQGP